MSPISKLSSYAQIITEGEHTELDDYQTWVDAVEPLGDDYDYEQPDLVTTVAHAGPQEPEEDITVIMHLQAPGDTFPAGVLYATTGSPEQAVQNSWAARQRIIKALLS